MYISFCKYCNQEMGITQYDARLNYQTYGEVYICDDCIRKLNKLNKHQKKVLKI
jgi:predicted SprT family Zn-dependent metalloprotease